MYISLHKNLKWILLLLIAVGPLLLSGQALSKKAQKLYEEGREHLNWDRFAEAEKSLLQVTELEPQYLMAYKQLLLTQIKQLAYDRAYATVSRIKTLQPNDVETNFQLAKYAFASGKYDQTLEHVKDYLAAGTPHPKRQVEIDLLIRNATFAAKASKQPFLFKPYELPYNINTELREYYPVVSADGRYLYFTRQERLSTGELHEELWFSEWQKGEWSIPYKLNKRINTPANEGAPSLTADGKYLYYTQCELDEGFGGCDIYRVQRIGNNWGPPENIGPTINTKAKETQPSLSADGQYLYFASSRPGGFGKIDLWVSKKQDDDTWGIPTNLGPSINTPGMDERPFLHPDGRTLYFASDGHPGFGGLDVFFTKKEFGKWTTPTNMGPPLNNYNDQTGLTVSTDGGKGFYATGDFVLGNDLNIYAFDMPEHGRPEESIILYGKVTDAIHQNGLMATIQASDKKSGELLYQTQTDDNGSFVLSLPSEREVTITTISSGFLLKEDELKVNAKTVPLKIDLQPLQKGQSLVLNNIYFAKNEADILPSSINALAQLHRFLKANPKTGIEIEGHTDNTGTPTFNLKLSQARAKSVHDELIKMGISSSQLQFKGYGETRPVAENTTDKGRAMNRRTQVVILDL